MPAPDLSPAEIDMLRGLPETLRAADMTGWTPRQRRDAKLRERLQRARLLTVRAEGDGGGFLVMITEAGVDLLNAAQPRRGAGAA